MIERKTQWNPNTPYYGSVWIEMNITCLMLVNGRHDMCQRAIRSWRSQTAKCDLLIYDTGDPYLGPVPGAVHIRDRAPNENRTIGELRNAAIECALSADVIVHWDSDDWSHSRRVEEQVAMLQYSGTDVIGYNESLFWDGARTWIYSNRDPRYCIGASMCYWRGSWTTWRFERLHTGEDTRWLSRQHHPLGVRGTRTVEPRMICAIHPGNTSGAYRSMTGDEWISTDLWTGYCREKMAL